MRLALAGLLCLLAMPAAAQNEGVSDEIIAATAGYWLLTPAAGGPGCNLRLLTDQAIGGWGLDVPADCAAVLPVTTDFAAWTFADDGLRFIDPLRHPLLALQEQEWGAYTADAPDGGYQLTPSEEGVVALPTPAMAAGDWILRRPDGPVLCRLGLAEEPPPGGEESFALAVAPGCDPAVAALRLASWRIEGVALMLYGEEGRSLAFLADGSGGFRKAPREGGRPLLMLRPEP
jgi:hypothetical protein